MRTFLHGLLVLCLVPLVAACGQPVEEPVYVDTPIAAEPVFTGKYN